MAQSVGAVALDIVMGKNTVSNVAKQAIQDVQKTFNDSSATIGNKASAVGTASKNIGASLAPVSVAAQAVIKSTADAAMSFETAIAQVETIAGDASVKYKGSMMDMSDAIMQLSSDNWYCGGRYCACYIRCYFSRCRHVKVCRVCCYGKRACSWWFY